MNKIFKLILKSYWGYYIFNMKTKIVLHFLRNGLFCLALVAVALLIGMLGYREFERMSWIDSFINAAMILSGMGPESSVLTTAGKLFAGLYALFSGLIFIAIVVMMLSPAIHALFRKIHLENQRDE